MTKIVFLLVGAAALMADEDSWAKVRELKSGTELRIYQVNAKEPIAAKLDRATQESLIVITRNEQVSIPKESIERIDRRRGPSRPLVKNTRTERKIARQGAEYTSNTIPGATTSVTTGLELPSKPGFEKIYSRTAPKK